MRKTFALLATAAALAAGFGSAQAAPASTTPSSLTKTCSRGYVLAHLSWGDKCLRAGEFCKVGNREYLKYHFYCPPTGHLKRR
jgi:hypothetical protein